MTTPAPARASSPSNQTHVRVFVTFKEDAVFAGEDVEATITFKNVNVPSRPQGTANPSVRAPPAPTSRRPSTTSFLPSRATHSRQPSLASQTTAKGTDITTRSPSHGHRHAHSLTILDNGPKAPSSTGGRANTIKSASHSRSVSIVSLGNDAEKPKKGRPLSMQRDPGRPNFKLSRSTSVQGSPGGPRSSWQSNPSTPRPPPSPLSTAVSPPLDNVLSPVPITPDSGPIPISHGNGNGHGLGRIRSMKSRASSRASQSANFPPSSFKFPATPEPANDGPESTFVFPAPPDQEPVRPSMRQSLSEPPAINEPKIPFTEKRLNAANRILSLSSDNGTPRSSLDQTEVYSSSNHSDDTAASSDNPRGPISRLLSKPNFFRQPSQLGNSPRQKAPETLMMGFVQLHGSFTVDGSLVNQGPFEEVKRRAVIGGQGGGGVVGIDRPKQEGRLFGSFSWGNIGESLGGILGSNEPSSMREMKGKAQSNSVPLLSTPKAILFVDLKLAPGESKSYTYKIPVPRGLPPSHKGRAMKIAYQLVIGTQRVGSGKAAREQQIRHVEVPFRLFGGVDPRGDITSHDLLSPYIVLRDQAQTGALSTPAPQTLGDKQRANKRPSPSSEADFNHYVQSLLSNPRRRSSVSLISPMAMSSLEERTPTASQSQTSLRRQSMAFIPLDMRALIDDAIRSGSGGAQPGTSRTNFTIARGGQPIANLVLSRPSLRLGDLLHVTLDFGAARAMLAPQVAPSIVHTLTITLESSEIVDAALVLRSAASVERVTRRVWDRRIIGGVNAAALSWCSRWAGSLKIPSAATPTFSTSGVGCSWCVRVEIGVEVNSRLDEDEDEEASSSEAGPESNISRMSTSAANVRKTRSSRLLEKIGEDERGTTTTAMRQLSCETFEIAVPIRVFGAAGATDSSMAREAQEMEGLSI